MLWSFEESYLLFVNSCNVHVPLNVDEVNPVPFDLLAKIQFPASINFCSNLYWNSIQYIDKQLSDVLKNLLAKTCTETQHKTFKNII